VSPGPHAVRRSREPKMRPTYSLPLIVLPFLAIAVPGVREFQEPSPRVLVVPVTGTIEHGLAPFIERSLKQAADEGAQAVILDIDTPGGRVDAAERITDAITEANIPVYALVNVRAFSAGAMIALATDGIYMRPGSVIGAATPVLGEGIVAPEKYVSAMRASMRALAEARGLDPRVAEAMVDEDIVSEGVIEEGKLLTLTTDEAASIDYAVPIDDLDALLLQLELEQVEVIPMEVNWAEHIVRFFAHPAIAPFLLTVGFLGILTEIKTPTFGVAGAAAIVSLTLFFGSHLILGLAGIEDLLIFGAGLAFIAIEIFLIPGFGIFGFLGILGVVGGLYMGLLGSLPTTADLIRGGMVITTALLLVTACGWVLIRKLPDSPSLFKKSIFLSRRMDRSQGFGSADVRSELVGMEGRALTDLRPAGTALINNERLDVVTDSEWVRAGTPVQVISAEGYRRVVRPIAGRPKS